MDEDRGAYKTTAAVTSPAETPMWKHTVLFVRLLYMSSVERKVHRKVQSPTQPRESHHKPYLNALCKL